MSTNIFAALAKTKKQRKPKPDSDEQQAAAEAKVDKHAELEKAIFAASTGPAANWADDSEEDEDEWGAGAHAQEAGGEGWSEVRRGADDAYALPPWPPLLAPPNLVMACLPFSLSSLLQAKGGYNAAGYGYEAQQPEPTPKQSESEEEVRRRRRPAAGSSAFDFRCLSIAPLPSAHSFSCPTLVPLLPAPPTPHRPAPAVGV